MAGVGTFFPLYSKSRSRKLNRALFRNPTAEYRGTPFWSWNDKLHLPQLKRQVEQLRQMGFGGFHVHSRTGLADEYLGRKYMRALVECTELAASKKMLSWLYDEDRWPSGSAGGIVTRDERFRIRHLLFTRTPYRTDGSKPPAEDRNSGTRSENGHPLARYAVALKDGRLREYRRLGERDRARSGERIWYAYIETPQPSTWFNGQTYVDTLSKPAISRFIEVTHEKLKSDLKPHFGKTIPAIFTDEPQFTKKTNFRLATDTTDQFLPWTPDFAESFSSHFKFDLLDHLPELFWNLTNDAPSRARWCFHDHVAERFAAAFGDTIGNWCTKNGIAFTGHLLGEVNLAGQSRGIGEAMRPLRSFHIPGIDILCDRLEFTTAKQAQSIARQYGRPGVLSELYGVTNWDYDFVGHKAQGDWQAALGVTVRVPHLTWQSMRGEAKRDYPASIGYQSPWYLEYPLIEDHFARLNTVLTRGRSMVRVGVVHPIESYWLAFGPAEQNAGVIAELEERFESITHWLLRSQIDFDFISESLLPLQSRESRSRAFNVGEMKYDVVILPGLKTIRSSTLKRLVSFLNSGGKVICLGGLPQLVDATTSAATSKRLRKAAVIPFEKHRILDAVDSFRDLEVTHADGSATDSILYQLREDGKERYLFLCNLDRTSAMHKLRVRMPGRWRVRLMDTMTGEIDVFPVMQNAGTTELTLDLAAHGHALLWLSPGKSAAVVPPPRITWKSCGTLSGPVPVTLSEPNVLLLDRAEWRLNDGPWQQKEELLRIDNLVRRALNLTLRGSRIAQPWADQSPSPAVGMLELRFVIDSRVAVRSPKLALEDRSKTTIQFNGNPIRAKTDGWWVDEAIDTVPLPSFAAGQHELMLKIPMTRKTNVEWCYLLGNFGVRVAGACAHLIDPVRSLHFGDWVHQGLPFYAGNVIYRCELRGHGRPIAIEIPRYKSPLLSVDLDGKPAGKIAFAPFRIELGNLKGRHRLDITAYGNRANAFGPVHHSNENLTWVGPGAWRSEGSAWADEYQLKRMGILLAPMILEQTS